MKRALLTAVIAWLLHGCGVGHAADALRDGDIIFQTSKSGQSLAIQRATGSKYSHMGLVVFQVGKPFVFEASATVRFTVQAKLRERDGTQVPLDEPVISPVAMFESEELVLVAEH